MSESKERKRERMQRYKAKLKHSALMRYGAVCAKCGERDESLLELDHVNGHGNAHRDKLFKYGHASPGGWNFYLSLKKLGYPSEPKLEVICRNCHDIKHDRVGKERHSAPAMSNKEDMYDDKVPF